MTSGCCETDRTHVFDRTLCKRVRRNEHASRKSQHVAEELLRLRVLTALPERARQVARRDQRTLVLGAEKAGRGDEDVALDLKGLGVLALIFE